MAVSSVGTEGNRDAERTRLGTGIGRQAPESMKALLTGGAGFIGSHVADRLLKEGYEVLVADNLSFGRMSNISHVRARENFTFERVDLKDSKSVDRIMQRVDVVFHLAAHADERESSADHQVDLRENVVATMNLLDSMRKQQVPELDFASSSAVYGEPTVFPTPESYAPIQTNLYGASKLACEAFAEAYTELYDLKFWSFRFANVVGARHRRGVIWDFVSKLLKDKARLSILGDGNQVREFIYISDCVDAIMRGYRRMQSRSNILNIAVEERLTVNRVADIVTREMGLKGVERVYTGGAHGFTGDSPIIDLDVTRLKSLGWRQQVSAEEAVVRTARWSLGTQREEK